ncbi:MAG: N-acetylmuramoyl-L-alanine amidase [Candidatus Micrarchaeota archaeon]
MAAAKESDAHRKRALVIAFGLLVLLALILQGVKHPEWFQPAAGAAFNITTYSHSPAPGVTVLHAVTSSREGETTRVTVSNSNKETTRLGAIATLPEGAGGGESSSVTVEYGDYASNAAAIPGASIAQLEIPAGGSTTITASTKKTAWENEANEVEVNGGNGSVSPPMPEGIETTAAGGAQTTGSFAPNALQPLLVIFSTQDFASTLLANASALQQGELPQNEVALDAIRRVSRMRLSSPAAAAFNAMASAALTAQEATAGTVASKVAALNVLAAAYEAGGSATGIPQAGAQLFKIASGSSTPAQRVQETMAYALLLARLDSAWRKNGASESEKARLIQLLNAEIDAARTDSLQGSVLEKFKAAEAVVANYEKNSRAQGQATPAPGASPTPETTATPKAGGTGGEDAYAFFPKLPEEITLTVTELEPRTTLKIPLITPLEINSPLTAFEGDVANYASQQHGFEGGVTTLNIIADVTDIELGDDGSIPFDEVKGTMSFGLLDLPERVDKVPVTLKVEHIQLKPEDCGEEYDATSYLETRVKQSAAATATGACGADGLAVVQEAAKHVGKLPYVKGGTSLSTGADCSGFVQSVMRKLGVTLPRMARQQYTVGTRVEELVPGDLVFFKNTDKRGGITHVGMYAGNAVESKYGKCAFINEPSPGRTASISSLCNSYNQAHYAGAVRVIPSCRATLASSTSSISMAPEETTATGLEGKVIAIDVAHAGSCTPPLAGELDATMTIAGRLSQLLQQTGATAVTVTEEECNGEAQANVQARADTAASAKADLMLELSFASESAPAAQFKDEKSRRLAAIMLSQLQAATSKGAPLSKAGVESSAALASIPAVSLAIASPSSPFNEPEDLERIAQSLFGGLQIYFGDEPSVRMACKESELVAVGGVPAIASTTPARVAACNKYDALLQKELGTAGLLAAGVSVDFVKALIMQESGCRENPPNRQGPMQVVSCAKSGCSLEENIRNGVRGHLLPAFNAGVKAGLRGEKLLQFMGLYYNRGSGTAATAKKLWEGGMPFKQALNEACLKHFAASKCNRKGYGAYYYDAVQQRCSELYGHACAVPGAAVTIPQKTEVAGSNGKVVVLDAGHGIGHPKEGATSIVDKNVLERDVNLAVALEAGRLLQQKGYTVRQTRATDYAPAAGDASFTARNALKKGADAFISIHANGGAPAASGTETYYWDARAETTLTAKCKLLAQAIHTRLVGALGTNDRGLRQHPSTLYAWGAPEATTVLVELAYLSNAGDARKLASPEYRKAAAQAIAEGVDAYLKSA